MDAINSQLLYRYAADRSPERPEQSSLKHHPLDGHHSGRRVGHSHRAQQGQAVELRREVDDRDDDRRQKTEDADERSTLSYRRSERTTLQIKTQEGDTVRLKIKASESLSVAAGQAEDGETFSGVELQALSRTRISFKVKGELNEQEMGAIQAVIAQAGTMAEDFFSGNLDDAFATASALEIDATQLANIRIRMKTSEQLTYPTSGALPARLEAPQASSPDATGTSPAPVIEGSADTTESAPAGSTGQDDGIISDNGEAAAALPVPAEAAVDSADTDGHTSIMVNTLQSIGAFLNKLMDTFSGDSEVQEGGVSADSMTLKLQVFRSLLLSVNDLQNPDKQEPASELAADTLDVISAQQTPLDAVA
ncbi:MAG: hypothetical protein WBO34_15565 [Gammaproteobacteria bacterium]